MLISPLNTYIKLILACKRPPTPFESSMAFVSYPWCEIVEHSKSGIEIGIIVANESFDDYI